MKVYGKVGYDTCRKKIPRIKNSLPSKFPVFSIVIPSYGGLGNIPQIVERIREKYTPDEVEIVLVVEGLKENEEKKVEELREKYDVKALVSKERLGKVNALNKGIKASKGDVLIFIDSDAEPLCDIVECVKEALSKGDFGSGVIVLDAKNLLQRMERLDYLNINTIVKLMSKDGICIGLNGAFIFAKREVVEKLNGFAHEIVEDVDFGIRASDAGFKPVFINKPCVKTTGPETLYGWFKQRKRWAIGGAAVVLRHLKTILKWWRYVFKNFALSYSAFIIYLLILLLPNGYLEKAVTTILAGVSWLFPPIIPFLYLGMMYFGIRSILAVFIGFFMYLVSLFFQLRMFKWKISPVDPIVYFFLYGPMWFLMTLGALVYVLIKRGNVRISGWKV